MADNVIKSTDINKESEKPVKKAAPKKATAKKVEPTANGAKNGFKIVVFESGQSYVSNSVRFTRENHIQEVPEAEAEILLAIENFRLPDQLEIEEYLNSKED